MPAEFYYKQGFHAEGGPKNKSDSIFNLINDKENLSRINKIANEGVNHIVAAYFIKSVQQSRSVKNEVTMLPRRSSVPINSVSLIEDLPQEGDERHLCSKAKELEDLDTWSQNEKKQTTSNQAQTFLENANYLNSLSLKTSMFNDKYTSEVNEFTNNQLNTVNDIVKKLKDNKISEHIENTGNSCKK